jgi:hypothetical protein
VGSDGLAVAAVGALGQVLAEAFDLADVGLPLVGMRSDGEYDDLGGGGSWTRLTVCVSGS